MIDRRNRTPNRRDMTGGAVVGRFDVALCLARCLRPIVAKCARLGRGAVIHNRRQREPARVMANVAGLGGRNMRKVFAAGEQSVVANITLAGDSLKHTIAMAGFAGDQLVPPVQRKTGRDVIEFFRRLYDAAISRRRDRNKQYECGQYRRHTKTQSGPSRRHSKNPEPRITRPSPALHPNLPPD